jgi:hypothetical protein
MHIIIFLFLILIILIFYFIYHYYITFFNINFNIYKKCNQSHLYFLYTFIEDYKFQIKTSLIVIITFSLIFLFIFYYLRNYIQKNYFLIIPFLLIILIISIIIIDNLNNLDKNDEYKNIKKFYKDNKENVILTYKIINEYYHIFNILSKNLSKNIIFKFSIKYKKDNQTPIDENYNEISLNQKQIDEIRNKINNNEIVFNNEDFKYFDLKSSSTKKNYIIIDEENYIEDTTNYFYIFKFSKKYIKDTTSSIDNTYNKILLDEKQINEIKKKINSDKIVFNNKDFKYFDLKSINNTKNYITIDNENYIQDQNNDYFQYKINKNQINDIINLIKIYNDIINNIYKIDINNHIYITNPKLSEDYELFKYINYNKKDSIQNNKDSIDSIQNIFNYNFNNFTNDNPNTAEIEFNLTFNPKDTNINDTFYNKNFLELFCGKKISFFYLSDLILISIIIIIFLLLSIDKEEYLPFLTSYKFFIIIILIIIINKLYNY